MPLYLNHLAVYGTLRKGQKRGFLEKVGCEYVKQITVPGKLYDLGKFPGYIDNKERGWGNKCKGSVLCDLFKLPEKREHRIEIIKTLDEIENYLYNRTSQKQCYRKAGATNQTPYKDRYVNYSFYIYTIRDWVTEGTTQITPGDPADWVEWKTKSNAT
jgi:gamma-glutamylcyclotransferase (GGCT)/AIG2-like uncharacterized protein YtfP